MALQAAVKFSKAVLEAELPAVVDITLADVSHDTVPVRETAAGTLAVLMVVYEDDAAQVRKLLTALTRMVKDTASDVRRAAVTALKKFAKSKPAIMSGLLLEVVPTLTSAVKDPNLATKLAAERALLHTLQINTDPDVLKTFTATCGAELKEFLSTYVRKVLTKLDADSEDEGIVVA